MSPTTSPTVTDHDVALVESCLNLLFAAGIALAEGIEPADVEDAAADDLMTFRAFPMTTVAGLNDPDGTPLLCGAVISTAESEQAAQSPSAIMALVERYADAAGAQPSDVAVVPDPGSDGATGSVRVRFGEWDVTDIDYDFTADTYTRTVELDIIAAALPLDGAAATFSTPDGRDITLFIPAGADDNAVDALLEAIDAEFEAS